MIKLPTRSKTVDIFEQTRYYSKKSLYFFATGVLGFDRLRERLHLPMCNFIQLFPWNCGMEETNRKLLWAPRIHFKSTIVSIALPLWFLIHDRNATIALISSKSGNSEGWLTQIKNIIEGNRWFRKLFPEIIPGDVWASDNITIMRDKSLGGEAQSTITASSMGSGQASQHYHHIIIDDPVDEQVALQPAKLAHVVEAYTYLESLLRDWTASTFTVTGTPYGHGDVIEHILENEVAHGSRLFWGIGARGGFTVSPQLKHLSNLVPLSDVNDYPGTDPGHPDNVVGPWVEGKPILPEECPERKLRKLEKEHPATFFYQYLCKPYGEGLGGFEPKNIGTYVLRSDGFSLKCECHPTHSHSMYDMSVIGLWDPAVTPSPEALRSAIVVVGLSKCGCRFLLDEWADTVEPHVSVDKMVELVRRWRPFIQNVGIETVGAQVTFKSWLEMLKNEGKFPSEVTIHKLTPGGREKTARIKSQQKQVNTGLWHILPSAVASAVSRNFMWELETFPSNKYRDLLDAGFGYCDDMWCNENIYMHTSRFDMGPNLNDQQEDLDKPRLMKELW